MFQKVLIFSIILVLVVLLITWLASGALGLIAIRAADFDNPVRDYLENARLDPDWTLPPPTAIPTVSVPGATISDSDSTYTQEEIRQGLLDAEAEYDRLRAQVVDAKNFGDPSPMRGTVWISEYFSRPGSASTNTEYVTLEAAADNDKAISLRGWSLQSAYSGVRVMIPEGSAVFRLNAPVSVAPIELAPGSEATVISGISPVGVSFRLNSCVGYLEQFQDFYPTLPNTCPYPEDELPPTAENYQLYGESCVAFVETLPHCRYHLGTFPEYLSNACVSFIKSALTYNSCVDRHRWRPSFADADWYIYLNAQKELWHNTHDVIRLLDEKGRTVSVYSY